MFWEYALRIALLPTVATLVLYFYNSLYKKEKKPFQTYYNLYFGLLVIEMFFFTIESRACVDVTNRHISIYHETSTDSYFSEIIEKQIKEELHFLQNIECLNSSQREKYQNKLNYELEEGHRCFNEAKKLCLMIPNCTDQEKAQKLFEIAITTAAGYAISGFGGVVGTLIAQLALYLKNYVNEYQQMKTLLLESKSHYEMAAFYQDILNNG